jgi:1-aminocyclopropane-1-carboxylate deaminase
MGGVEPRTALPLRLPSPLEELHDDRLLKRAVRLLLKRDDLIHPAIPGNKWRKLKYNLTEAMSRGQRTLLTFGGAYSNHMRPWQALRGACATGNGQSASRRSGEATSWWTTSPDSNKRRSER